MPKQWQNIDDRQAGLAGGSEPPHDGGMEARVAKLEDAVTGIRVSLGKIETRLESMDSNMATKLWVMTGAVIVLVAVIGGFWWMAQQYLGPILRSLPK